MTCIGTFSVISVLLYEVLTLVGMNPNDDNVFCVYYRSC